MQRLIGLTGGIAAGKSTCAKILAQWGVTIHEADAIAKSYLQPHQETYHKCVAYFGEEILVQGNIDRRKLRTIIFQNDTARLWLSGQIQPLVRKELLARSLKPTKFYHLLVIPLLFENKFDYGLSKTIAVISDHQLERACLRDNMDANIIQAIINTQATNHERIKQADFIVNNDRADLIQQLSKIHQTILASF